MSFGNFIESSSSNTTHSFSSGVSIDVSDYKELRYEKISFVQSVSTLTSKLEFNIKDQNGNILAIFTNYKGDIEWDTSQQIILLDDITRITFNGGYGATVKMVNLAFTISVINIEIS